MKVSSRNGGSTPCSGARALEPQMDQSPGSTVRQYHHATGRADFPVAVARAFVRRLAEQRGSHRSATRVANVSIKKGSKARTNMRHGTNDLRAAYRHVPTS